MGSTASANPSPDASQAQLIQLLYQQMGVAEGQAIQATQQNVGGLALEWLRNYGQTTAMKAAGIGAPFSTIGGGFATPFARASGAPMPGVIGTQRA
jgi:hypothetical protein